MVQASKLLAAAGVLLAGAVYATDSSSSLGLGATTGDSSALTVGLDDTSSSSSTGGNVGGGYDNSHSSGGTVASAPSKNTLSTIAGLEAILLKVIYKAFNTLGELSSVLGKDLGAPEKAYHGYWYDLGATDGAKDKLYWLEKELAAEIKEAGKIVGTKLKVAFGHQPLTSAYKYSYMDTDSHGNMLSGYWYKEGNVSYPPHHDGEVGEGVDWHKKYYSSYPVFMPPYKDYLAAPYKMDVGYAADKLATIKALLYTLKGLDYKSIKQIKAIKEILHAIKAARLAGAVTTTHDDTSSSSTGGLGAGGAYDDTSSSATLGSGNDSSSYASSQAKAALQAKLAAKLAAATSKRVARLLKLLAKAEAGLAATLKAEGKVAKKLQQVAFALKAGLEASSGKHY